MTAVSIQNRYPRQGDVAILCEGDVAGFEVDLLEKWTALRAPEILVDVWACGTQESIFGFADAIGRARPIMVIEDRDYRTPQEAAVDCEAKRKDRVKRAVRLCEWKTWSRNEIENYLIEPAAVVPVLADYFGTTERHVRDRLEEVIACSIVDQAAQFALNRFWHELPPKSRYIGGLPRKTARPFWSVQSRNIVAPPVDDVRKALKTELEEKTALFQRDGLSTDPKKFVESFESKCEEWRSVTTSSSTVWLHDWAGKDILTSLCRWLAGEFGIRIIRDQYQGPVDWDALAKVRNPDRTLARKDREIERLMAIDLQPGLVQSFLGCLPNSTADMRGEWDSLLQIAKHAVMTS